MASVLIGVSKIKLCLQTTLPIWWLKTDKFSFFRVVTTKGGRGSFHVTLIPGCKQMQFSVPRTSLRLGEREHAEVCSGS